MATTFVDGLVGAGAWFAAAAFLLGLCRTPWLRMHETQQPLSPGATAARVVGSALLSSAAVVAAMLALMAIRMEVATPEAWAVLARPETIAAVGLVLLVGLVDAELERIWLFIGSGVSAVAAWGGAVWLEESGLATPLPLPSVLLSAGILSALMLSPGWTARRVARLRRQASGAEPVHVLLVDRSGHLLHASDAAREMLALAPRRPRIIGAREPLPKALHTIVAGDKPEAQRIRTAAGLVIEARSVGPASGFRRARALVLRDVTDDHRHKRRLFQLAHHDSLTGLANRRLFLERLKKLVQSSEAPGDRLALFYVDLDDFKATNDSLGHAVGDALLGELADRFRAHLRPEEMARFGIEAEGGLLVARLAGDEFAVIAPGVPDAETAGELARFLLELIRRPLDLPDRTLTPSASIGIALFPAHGRDVETLLHHADSALYLAKGRGRQRFALYEASLNEEADRARLIEEGLRTALERGEMCLHYQPKVDANTGELVGLEALMRWKSPTLGDIGPSEFIPVAEDQRALITTLGTWGLDEACRQIRAWQDAGHVPVPVSVNVSSAQFSESDLQRVVSEALDRHRVEPRYLELELTESLLLDERSQAEQVLRDLRSIGVRIALDDFGTGYSALTYLNRFSLDVLKIDRSLLREIDADPSALGIASAVVSMAHSLGLHVVAEGVDAEEQLVLLRKMHCDQIQGFLFAPALPAEEVARFIRKDGEQPVRLTPGTAAPGKRPGEREEAGALAVRSRATSPLSAQPVASTPRSEGSVLLVDDDSRSLATLAMRLVHLGIDAHYASALDEGRLFIAQESASIRLLAFPPSVDLEQAQRIRESLVQSAGEARSWVVLGERPEESVQRAIRKAGVDWVLWAPFTDAELRYVMKCGMALRSELAERRETRVPVDLVAKFQSGDRREVAVVSSLSVRGAFVEMSSPLAQGKSLRIEIDLGGDWVRGFARVAHVQPSDPTRPGEPSGVGVVFYSLDRNEERLLRKAVGELQLRYLP